MFRPGGVIVNMHQLQCFVTVAEETHFGHAAEKLHLTASPLSRAIKDLEKELGAELFVRGYHHVELTAAGRDLLPRALQLLTDFNNLRTAVALEKAPAVVHVGGTHFAPPKLLDRVIAVAESVVNDRPIDLHLASSADLLAELESGQVVVALVHLPVDAPCLEMVPLAKYRVHVVMRADDPMAKVRPLTLAGLSDRTFVFGSPHVQPMAIQRMRSWLIVNGVTRFLDLPDNDTNRMASHVRRGTALALSQWPGTGGAYGAYNDEAFAVVPLADDDLDFTIGIAWRSDRYGSEPDVRAVVDVIRAGWRSGPEVI